MAEEREIVTVSESADAGWRADHGPLVTGREMLLVLVWRIGWKMLGLSTPNPI